MKNEELHVSRVSRGLLLHAELALFLLHAELAELAEDFDITKVSTYHTYLTDLFDSDSQFEKMALRCTE